MSFVYFSNLSNLPFGSWIHFSTTFLNNSKIDDILKGYHQTFPIFTSAAACCSIIPFNKLYISLPFDSLALDLNASPFGLIFLVHFSTFTILSVLIWFYFSSGLATSIFMLAGSGSPWLILSRIWVLSVTLT